MVKTRIGNKADIDGILSLQEKYLYRNLNELERKSGFVTTPFTVNQIEEILLQNGIFIAENEQQIIVAYAFAGSWKYFEQWGNFQLYGFSFSKIGFQWK